MGNEEKIIWIKVAGIGHANTDGTSRIKYLMGLKDDEKLELVRDKNNPFDPFAIKVIYGEGLQIGWIPKDYTNLVANYLDKNVKYSIQNLSKRVDKETYRVSCEFKLIIHN